MVDEFGEHDNDAIPDASVAVTERVTLRPGIPPAVETFMNEGQTIEGLAASTTVIRNEQDDVLFALSVAEQLTTVTPKGKIAPLVALQP